MRPAEQKLTRFLCSRACSMLLVALAAASAFVAMPDDVTRPLAEIDRGLLFPSPSHWIDSATRSRSWALVMNVLIMLVMALINRRYNLIRTMSWLFIGMFAAMEAASPETLRIFGSGQLSGVVVLWCMTLMFSAYHRRRQTKRVFMAFCLMSAAAMAQYGFVVYVPVFVIGCVQLRIFTWRMLTAALLGIVTPWWIALGMGWAEPDQFHLPSLHNPFVSIASVESLQLFIPAAVTLVAGLFCGAFNLLKIIGMNARMRALNGFLALTSIITGVMAIADFTNIEFYIPLLNACVAFQLGHFMRINLQRRGYLLILMLLSTYIGLWIWKLIV